jgi:hypothetical protein
VRDYIKSADLLVSFSRFMSCKATLSIREFESPTMGRALWVRSLNREIINDLPLRMKGDVINNPTHSTHKYFQHFLTPCRSTRKPLSSTVLSEQNSGSRVTF